MKITNVKEEHVARDTQRTMLYRAEQSAERRLLQEERDSDGDIAPRNPRLMEMEAVALVGAVAVTWGIEMPAVRFAEPPKPEFNHDAWELTLPSWARCPLVILHQMAHAFVHPNFPAHGAEFIDHQLSLYGAHLGDDVAEYFRKAYELEGVQTAPSPKQARRFLPYCKKMVTREGRDRLIHVITREAEIIVDNFVDFDSVDNTLHVGDRRLSVHDLRYASWATAAA